MLNLNHAFVFTLCDTIDLVRSEKVDEVLQHAEVAGQMVWFDPKYKDNIV